jgi:hypothetical protein
MDLTHNTDTYLARIYALILERRHLSEQRFAAMFGIETFANDTEKWRSVEIVLEIVDLIGDADNLYKLCECGYRNPFDRDYSNMSEKEIHDDQTPCENCGTALFTNSPL